MLIINLVEEITGQKEPASQFRGSNQIDKVWSTKDVNCGVPIFLPLWSVIGYTILSGSAIGGK